VGLLNTLPRDTQPFPIGHSSLRRLLHTLVADPPTLHEFRATFKTWCGDHGAAPREIAEAALNHRIGNKVEQSYDNATRLIARRTLMTQWENFCFGGQ
jgi:hypothetical protein